MRAVIVRIPGVHSWEQKLGTLPSGMAASRVRRGAPDTETWVKVCGYGDALPDDAGGLERVTLAQFRRALTIAAEGGDPWAGHPARTDRAKAAKAKPEPAPKPKPKKAGRKRG